MEKNLPFVSFSVADKGYNKLILPLLGKLDNGNVFKNIITFLLSLGAIGFLLGGIYLSFTEIFGDSGFRNTHISNAEGMKMFGAIIGLIIGFAVSISVAWVLYSVLKKRTEQLKAENYNGILDFVFIKTFPKLILIIGELLFILVLYVGILQIIASLVGSSVYAPLNGFPGLILGIIPDFVPGIKMLTSLIPTEIQGDYDKFGEFLKVGLIASVMSFVLLSFFYIYKEVYCYLIKVISALIAFLPKFAIPIALRHRNETAVISQPSQPDTKPRPSVNLDEL